jgi:hypothetical protein
MTLIIVVAIVRSRCCTSQRSATHTLRRRDTSAHARHSLSPCTRCQSCWPPLSRPCSALSCLGQPCPAMVQAMASLVSYATSSHWIALIHAGLASWRAKPPTCDLGIDGRNSLLATVLLQLCLWESVLRCGIDLATSMSLILSPPRSTPPPPSPQAPSPQPTTSASVSASPPPPLPQPPPPPSPLIPPPQPSPLTAYRRNHEPTSAHTGGHWNLRTTINPSTAVVVAVGGGRQDAIGGGGDSTRRESRCCCRVCR